MLTTIPFDDFISLTQQLKEDFSDQAFNWNDFLKVSSNPKVAVKYLNACNVKKLGKGSSRTAYALKHGDVSSDLVNGPCVLKIATHPSKGPAQNKAEVKLLEKYQHKMECFPKLYAYDRQNWNYVLVELGTPLDKTPAKIRNEWLKPLREFFENYLDYDSYPDVDDPVLGEEEFKLKTPKWFSFIIRIIAEILAGELVKPVEDEEFAWYQGLMRNMCKSQIPIVHGIGSVLKYAQKHGSNEVSLGDLDADDNWAFVKRDESILLIPIDWGASSEVMKTYYKESMSFNELKRIVLEK